MSLREKVNEVKVEMDKFLKKDTQEGFRNSMQMFEGSSLSFSKVASILDKISKCEVLY